MSDELARLLEAARGGRVAHTGFLEPDKAAELLARLREAEVGVQAFGGYTGARRRIVTAFPKTIQASTALKAVYTSDIQDAADLQAALRQTLAAELIGDIIRHQEGLSVIVVAKASVPEMLRFKGQLIHLQDVPLEHLESGKRKRLQVIVPSLRVDAVGAKAFNVSRSYFSKGIAAGNVMVNGKRVGKSGDAEPGDEIYAEGLGRCLVLNVQGETRKGNLKVELELEKA